MKIREKIVKFKHNYSRKLTNAVSLEKYPQLAELADRLDGVEGLQGQKMKSWFRDAKIQTKIIDAMNRPAERLSWHR